MLVKWSITHESLFFTVVQIVIFPSCSILFLFLNLVNCFKQFIIWLNIWQCNNPYITYNPIILTVTEIYKRFSSVSVLIIYKLIPCTSFDFLFLPSLLMKIGIFFYTAICDTLSNWMNSFGIHFTPSMTSMPLPW